MQEERRFALPYEVEGPPGTEGWEDLYPYYTVFNKDNPDLDGFGDGQRGFWFRNTIQFPQVMYPIETREGFGAFWRIGQQNKSLVCIPPASGPAWKIHLGYLYFSPGHIADPEVVKERAQEFQKRIGYYFKNWRDLTPKWKEKTLGILRDGEKIWFPRLSEIVHADESYLEKGYGPADEILTNYNKLIENTNEIYIKHFELQGIGYIGYMGFYSFCKENFPKISDYRVTAMVQGFETDSYRGDQELQNLSRLALEYGIENDILEPENADQVFEKLGRSDKGKKWLERWKEVEDPWLRHSGDGTLACQWKAKVWGDDWNLPMGFIKGYVKKLQAGEDIERKTGKVKEEADRLAGEYGKLLSGDQKQLFEQQLNMARASLFFAEDHQFYVHGWGLVQIHNKFRELAQNFVDYGILKEVEDIKFLMESEIGDVIIDVIQTWSSYYDKRDAVGSRYWPEKIKRRKEIHQKLSEMIPPNALGYPPPEINEPYAIMLWGVTTEKLHRWLDEYHGTDSERDENVMTGMPGASGVVEGVIRYVPTTSDADELEDGEILLTDFTTPEWAPLFPRISGVVLEGGGVMSHAAIVAREYGIPAVVGVADATKRLKTGDRVRMNGEEGIVERL